MVVRALLLGTLPLLGVILWLGWFREPAIQTQNVTVLARAAAELRASALVSRLQLAQLSTEQLASTLTATTAPGTLNIPPVSKNIITVARAIPLDERGTIDLTPGENGLQSHIEIDLIRQAFAGELPPPDIIANDHQIRLVIARAYGEPLNGVVLADISPSLLQPILEISPEGQYWIEHTSGPSGTVRVLAGEGGALKDTRVAIEGSHWQLGFSPNPRWLSNALPDPKPLWFALAVVCLGAILSAIMLARSLPALLRRDVQALEAMSRSGEAPSLALTELQPLAKTLGQLSERGRSKLTADRQRIASAPPPTKVTTAIRVKDNSPAFSPPMASVEELSHQPTRQHPDEGPDYGPASLWHPCGFRGDTRSELDNLLAERLGAALAVLAQDRRVDTLMVVTDGRPSGSHLRSALVKALVAGGCNVIDGGAVPTPVLCHALTTGETQWGVVVTGGHNPEPINGFKIYVDGQSIMPEDLKTLRRFFEENRRTSGQGRVAKRDLIEDYNNAIALDIALTLPLKVVVDCGYGATSEAAPALLAALDSEVVVINPWGSSGSSDHRSTDQALHVLGQQVVTERADLGVLFDRDGDRLHVVTETGKPLSTAQLIALLSQNTLSRQPGATVVQDVALGPYLSSAISQHSGTVALTSGCIVELLHSIREQAASIGGSAYGHVVITERWHTFPDAIYACSRLLELLSNSAAPLSTLSETALTSMPIQWLFLPSAGTRVEEYLELAAALAPPDFAVTQTSGLRFDGDNGWFLLRAHSDREGLELVLGADSVDNLVSINATASKLLAKAAPDLASSLAQP